MSNEGVWKAWQAAAFESSVLSLCSHSLSKSAFNWSDLLLPLTVHLFSSGVFVSDYVCLTVNFGLAGRLEETLYVESIVSQLWYKKIMLNYSNEGMPQFSNKHDYSVPPPQSLSAHMQNPLLLFLLTFSPACFKKFPPQNWKAETQCLFCLLVCHWFDCIC